MPEKTTQGKFIYTTELPLRVPYLDAVDEAIKKPEYANGCMITIDIKNFHFFNRWYGRDAGDRMLHDIDSYLVNLSNNGNVIAGYIGGDNFSVFFPYSGLIINNVLDNVQDIVREHAKEELAIIPVYGAYRLSATDIADGISADDIYDYTANALKQTIEESICWFDAGSIKKLEQELHMLPETLAAMDAGEFTFYLQPKCHMKSGKIIGAEALARWISPTKGFISPGVFIPLLENHGLVSRLDLIIWEKVCAQIRDWQELGFYVPPISVNVSRVDILQLDVPMTFAHLVQKYDIKPSRVEIEITESAYTGDDKRVIDTVNQLHKMGFKVLIDDFGSGYSSLNLLKDIQADVLKLDMKFLESKDDNESRSFSIIESILEMSRQLKIPSIIEGVEHEKQIEMLEELGCEFAQGFYYYKPMSYKDFEMLLGDDGIIASPNRSGEIGDKSHLQQLSEYFIKVAEVNINSGKYKFLKVDDMHRIINNPEAENIRDYAKRFIDAGMMHSEDVPGYFKHFDYDYLKRKIDAGKRRFIHSIRYLYDGVYKWVCFEITVPENFSYDKNPELLFTWKYADGKISRTEDFTDLLASTLHKLVRINVATGSYEVIHMYGKEKTKKNGYDKDIKKWLINFAKVGNVHKDDVDAYLEFADFEKIRKYFKKNKKPMSIEYRRLVNNEYVPVEMTVCKSKEYSNKNPMILLYVK